MKARVANGRFYRTIRLTGPASAAFLGCCTSASGAELSESVLLGVWPAVLCLVGALAFGIICVRAITNSKQTVKHDDVSLWRALAENIADTILLLTQEGKILYANRWDANTPDVVGSNVDSLISEIERDRWRTFLATHNSNSKTCATAVFKLAWPHGGSGFWELRLAPIGNVPEGAAFILCCRDVTSVHLKEISKEMLYNVTLASARIDSLQELMSYVERQLSRLVDTRNFYLALYEQESNTYSKEISRDRSDEEADNSRLDLSGGLTDYVRKTGKAVLMNDKNREQLKQDEQLKSIGDSAACWLGVPLHVREEVLGVFVVQSYDDPNRFTNADLELLSIVAGSIGRAVERQRNDNELKQGEAKLRLLTERMPALLWSQDANSIVTYAAGAAFKTVGLNVTEVIGKSLCQIAQCEDSSLIDKTNFTSNSAQHEMRFKINDRQFEAFIEPITKENGVYAGATGVATDITERDQAAEELRRFVELSGNSFIVIDSKANFLRCNDEFLQMSGYTRDELINNSIFNFSHPDDLELATKEMARLATGETIISLELRTLCKDKSYKWLTWNSIKDKNNDIIYCSGKDITHRRQIENNLREREEQLRLFVQHSPAALAMFDRDMRYITASNHWSRDYGLGTENLFGRSHYEVFPEISQEWKEIHQRCLQGATEQRSKDMFPRADGSIDWVRWQIKPWLNSEDEIGGIIMFTEVITAEIEAELEISKSKNLARQIIDASLDAIVAINQHGRVTEWNPQAEKIFGYAREEAVGELLHHLIIPEKFVHAHLHGMEEYLRTANAQILNRLLHLPAKHKDGHEFQVEMSICAIQMGEEVHFSAFIKDISERLLRERELTESRAHLKEAQRIAGLGSFNWIVATDEIYVSDEKLVLYGRPDLKLPMSLQTLMEIVHPDDRQLVTDMYQTLNEGNNSFELNYRIVRPTGEIRHAYTRGEVVRDSNGDMVRFFGTTLDVTERVNAEERVRSSEERLALAIEGSSDGLWDWNVVNGDCYFSPRIVEWLEFEAHEFLHHVSFWEELIHPDYLNNFNLAYAEHVTNRTSHYEIEERVRTKNGNWIWVLSRGKIVQWNDDGSPLRAAGTWTNITLRKMIEARASQLGRILDNAINEVYIIDPSSKGILEANMRACVNMGYTIEEFQQLTLEDVIENWSDSNSHEMIPQVLNGVVEVGRSFGIHVRKNGTKYPFETTFQIMEWQDRTVIVAIGADISDRVKAEQEFENLQAQLRHAQRLETIGTLAGGIAHDFNNILTPILGYADMAAGELHPDSNARRDIDQVIHAAYRAKGLVQQILAFSRQNEQAYQPLQIDLVVKEALRLLRASVPPNIDFMQSIVNVGNVMSDPTMINQVVMNLCTNAHHAIGSEGGVIGVTLVREHVNASELTNRTTLSEGQYAKLTITDSGKGMDTATIERIFEPFFTTKEVGYGTGLGLSVVHGIVQAHHGAISVESELGNGTSFSVYLPILLTEQSIAVTTNQKSCRGDEHLLLCDDDEIIILLGKQMLEAYGYKVTTTPDPVAALALLAEAIPPISAIIVDDIMPILSGQNVALAAHDYNPNVPVILLSASLNNDQELTSFEAVLAKPVAAADLAHCVRSCIDKSKKVEKL